MKNYVEFCEKDYENQLYIQLAFGNNKIVTPNQIFEASFGVDAMIMAEHPNFWDYFGFNNIPNGAILGHFNYRRLNKKIDKNILPKNFSTNLLIQSKRPYKRNIKVNSNLRNLLSNPCLSFDIYKKQQLILEKVAKTLNHKALVIYASASFTTFNEYWQFLDEKKLVENCSYVKVEKMINHKKWNYDSPGTNGVATSKLEWISEGSLYDLLAKAHEQHDEKINAKNSLHQLSKDLMTICNELKEDSFIARKSIEQINYIKEYDKLPEYLMDYLISNIVFNNIGLQWFVIV